MGEWLITISAASVVMAVLSSITGEGTTAKTGVFVTGLIFTAISLEATWKLLGG